MIGLGSDEKQAFKVDLISLNQMFLYQRHELRSTNACGTWLHTSHYTGNPKRWHWLEALVCDDLRCLVMLCDTLLCGADLTICTATECHIVSVVQCHIYSSLQCHTLVGVHAGTNRGNPAPCVCVWHLPDLERRQNSSLSVNHSKRFS